MKQGDKSFRHESLQDTKSIRRMLKALTDGFDKGALKFSDEDGEIVLEPEGLLQLKLTASETDGRQRVNIRVTWQSDDAAGKRKKGLSVKSGGKK